MIKLRPHALVPTLMILAIAVSEMATDIYVPSLPFLTEYFSTTPETIAATLGWNLWGLGIASAFYGPLSDAYGRKITLITGLSIFTVASFACGLVPSVEWLLFVRVLQGVGAGVSIVVGSAVIKDLFDGSHCARIMSTMGIAIAISPAIAPVIGGYVAEHYSWHWVFFIVGAVCAMVLLLILMTMPETLKKQGRHPFSFSGSISNYFKLFSSLRFICYSMISALTFAALWAYISSTPFYFISVLGYSKIEYGYFQAVLVLTYILGSMYNRRLLYKFDLDTMLEWGLWLLVSSAVGLVAASYLFPNSASALCLVMSVNCFAMGIVFPNAVTRALEIFSELNGISSALITVLEMSAAGTMIWITGLIYHSAMLPVAILICITAILGGFCFRVSRYRDQVAPRST
jgi:DHA1 family bicyclomycin/chloramphenicol resistance-like MFS transporter